MEGEIRIEEAAEEAEELLIIEQKIAEYQKLLQQKQKLTEKLKEKEQQIIKEIEQKYSLNRKELQEAIAAKREESNIIFTAIDIMQNEGEAILNNNHRRHAEFRQLLRKANLIQKFNKIPISMLKSIISIETVKEYVLEVEEQKKQSELKRIKETIRTGRLSENTKYALEYIASNSPTDKQYMQHMKSVKKLTTADSNRIRWYLLHKKYIERINGRLTITDKGKVRLSE